MAPMIPKPVRDDSTTKICDRPLSGRSARDENVAGIGYAAEFIVLANGVNRKSIARVTKLNAKVHCGSFPRALGRAAATKVDDVAPTTVVSTPAAQDEKTAFGSMGAIKTAVAQPTRQPLYPQSPFCSVVRSRPENEAAVVDVAVPKPAKTARYGSPIARLPSRTPPDLIEFRKMT